MANDCVVTANSEECSQKLAGNKLATTCPSEILTEAPTLLGLPVELRLHVYSFLVDIKGTLTVYAEYEIAKEVDTQTVKLMHVNRLIRGEVQEFFYKNQKFEFRSTAAIDNFLDRIGRDNARLIKEVELGYWMCARLQLEHIINLLTWLTGLDSLVLMGIDTQTKRHKYLIHRGSDSYAAGSSTVAIMRASSNLGRGKVWVSFNFRTWSRSASTILFLPENVCPSAAYNPARSTPSSYVYPRQPVSGFWEVRQPSNLELEIQAMSSDKPYNKRRKLR